MTSFKKTVLAAAIAGAGMAGAGNAMAFAYAAAYDDIWDFSILEFAGVITNIQQQTNSKATATYNNDSDADSDPRDADVINKGSAARLNNDFYQGTGTYPDLLGKVGGYGVGDAWIPTLPTIGAGEATNYGEAYVAAGGNSADGLGENELNANITVTEGSQLRFQFRGLPYLIAEVSGDDGDFASADVDFSITLRQGGQTIFGWSPNGAIDQSISGTVGGTEQRDDYDLNTEISAFGGMLFDEFAPGGPIGGAATAGLFRATTNALSAGTYTLNVTMTENVNVETRPIPEPASLALMSLGLMGIGAARRKSRKA